MNPPKTLRSLWLALLLMLSLATVASAQGNTLTDTIANDERFSTLAELLETADLADTLADTGEAYTIFAPTNDAFAQLPAENLEALSENPDELRNVLLYHTSRGRTTGNGVAVLEAIPTLQGSNIRISENDGDVILDGRARVTETDITASNGVIHVIDTVLFPATNTATAVVVLPDSGAANSSLPTLIGVMVGALLILAGGFLALRRR